MARLPRLTAPGHAHHLIQRGNNGVTIFADADDCSRFLADLAELSKQHRLAVHAYALLPDHWHLLATPAAADSLARTMQGLGRRYVGAFNRRHGRRGTLWEGRFRSTVLEPGPWLLPCCVYIEGNPVRAGLTDNAAAYRWSSAAHHLGLRTDPLISEHPLVWGLGNTPFERQAAYRKRFDAGLSKAEVEAITHATRHGWALGSGEFIAALAGAIARRAAPRSPGRPARTRADQ